MTGVWEVVGLVKLVNDEKKFQVLLIYFFYYLTILTLYITTCYIFFFLLNHKHKRLADVLRIISI